MVRSGTGRPIRIGGVRGSDRCAWTGAMSHFIRDGIRAARRVVIGVVGVTVILVGVALIVLPGPAFIVIPIGLGILAIEFEWARRWLRRARELYASDSEKGKGPHVKPPSRES